MLLQQGDVLIKSVDKMPIVKEKVKKTERGYVLAEGEVTGHAHVIEDEIELVISESGEMFMKNDKEVTIKHEEHKNFKIPVGIWKIGIVKEYDHFAEEAKRVED